ncbi:MAG: hypothetical protein EKK48_19510 [Candidatus Melainabacteria bacterium]|nr:MAG: hypothetical protein EKK48_19510 [Candidatus Melainabacteria bacterium]
MRSRRPVIASSLSLLCIFNNYTSALAAAPNSQEFPTQILRTGVDLNSTTVSPNTRQLADILKLTPLIERNQQLRTKINPTNFDPTLENVAMGQQLIACVSESTQIIQEANLAVDFTLAEIQAEQNIYNEILNTYVNDRDKATLRTNALSFISNGALWSVCEGLAIPTNTHPELTAPSGITGILAGIIPSIASIYALKQLSGKKQTSEKDPNMLAKIFDYPVTPEIDYPKCVWDFLNSTQVGEPSNKTRRTLLIERWVADKNIPEFTESTATKQLDVITASVPRKKALNIATLNTRISMLQQLGAELLKMKRMLLELSMVIRGEKQM